MRPTQLVDGKKPCSTCKVPKAAEDFKPDKRRSSGLSSICRACHNSAGNVYRLNNLEKERARGRAYQRLHALGTRARRYGVLPERITALVRYQEGCCPGCRRDLMTLPDKKGFCVDHNHVTGLVRGVLCGKCNISLGQAQDSPAILRRLADYLERQGAGLLDQSPD